MMWDSDIVWCVCTIFTALYTSTRGLCTLCTLHCSLLCSVCHPLSLQFCHLGVPSKHVCQLPVTQVALQVDQLTMALTLADHFVLLMGTDFALIRTPFVCCRSHPRCPSHLWCFGWLVSCGLLLLHFDWSLSIGGIYGQCWSPKPDTCDH